MNLIKRTFRQWWQRPRNLADRPEHRQVTFLELFYDLVYVVLIAEFAHVLAEHINPVGIANFAFMFVIVWWAWLNGTTYHDLHGNDDIRTRVFTFLQMMTVVAMAIFAHDALGDTSVGFALSYAAFQLILTYLWWRTGVHDPHHRPLSTPYSIAFLLITLLFIGSVFVPVPIRFYLWTVGVALSLLMPVVIFNMIPQSPDVQAQIELSSQASPSLVERYGLFTIIVLGEVIVGVLSGVSAHHDLTPLVLGTGALGLLIAIGLWWLYFDFVSHRIPHFNRASYLMWAMIHLPLTMAIAATGSAILNVVEHTGEHLPVDVRWLMVSAVAFALLAIAGLTPLLQLPDEQQSIYRRGRPVKIIAAVLMLALGFFDLSSVLQLGVLAVLLLLPVAVALLAWMETLVEEKVDG